MTEQDALFPDPRGDDAPPVIDRSRPWGYATLSPSGVYRYSLTRMWRASDHLMTWIMLNPSTTDADVDDATIRRCMDFARRWGYDGMLVANLYALRATNPRDLWRHDDPVGPDNIEHLRGVLRAAGASEDRPVVAAWGVNARQEAVSVVTHMAREHGVILQCLGVTKDGAPRHPLYMRADTLPIPLDPTLRTLPRSAP